MDQRKRLFFVLTSLAGAMTSTASLLAWMAPTLPAATQKDATNMLGIARSLVTEDVPVQENQWQRIDIVPEPAAQSSGVVLASSRDNGAYHFFIDDRGSLSRASSWRGQTPAGIDPEAVRVRLAHSPANEPISARQSRALGALLRALDERVSPMGESLPVRLDPVFAPLKLTTAARLSANPMLSRLSG